MKILFYGDSITDAGRNRETILPNRQLGHGYVSQAAGRLYEKDAGKYEVYNRGISGNRVVDIYARIKADCWNLEPDVLSILIGVNDVWHEVVRHNGVELDRFENIYRTLLSETKNKLPNVKLIICEPFVLRGEATEEKFDDFLAVKEYAKVVRELADEFGAYFVPLQNMFDDMGEKYGNDVMLSDGVHPTTVGSAYLAIEWMKAFEKLEGDI
jgi:lysophospholipase L1-like esterase